MMTNIGGTLRTAAGRVGRVALAAGVAAVITFSMSGCFANPLEKIASGGVGNIVEQATGGKLDMGSMGQIPKDFPSEVPLLSTDVAASFSVKVDDGKAWTLGVRVDGSLDSVSEQVRRAFSQGDWEETSWSSIGEELTGGLFVSEAHNTNAVISVMTDDDSGKMLVNYVVTKNTD